ncbi:hypothetical protein GCM10010156_49760 [Planobispora rosea]|uniref:Uncharacterized protein n=1 Tax=Planobispora rosea TaxID=35762 RepID=A0A8J3S5V1_PLARO|nr:hypothetical protein [Planobispora rosea]GGS85195.1 hypothetical protein GCM10010156_49760 [Planobispora rosea]GIH86487.1 hypothetical protein Pro02_48950 [Planobispora rosea]
MSRQLALEVSPAVAFYQTPVAEAEELLITWRHPLHLPDDEYPAGRPYRRPFGSLAFVMEERGRRAAAVVLASTINPSVCQSQGLNRYNTVDLARIARSPDRRDRHCLRAVLRITRDYLAPLWLGRFPGWDARSAELCGRPQIEALASTSLPGTPGRLYRFDGFERIRTSTGAKGGGHQRPSAANAIADGARGLWVYRYPQPLRLVGRSGKSQAG